MSIYSNIKNKVVDKVSDAISYPARRSAQKAILNNNKQYNSTVNTRPLGPLGRQKESIASMGNKRDDSTTFLKAQRTPPTWKPKGPSSIPQKGGWGVNFR